MLQNAYFLAKIGADTAENEQHFAEILPTDALADALTAGRALRPGRLRRRAPRAPAELARFFRDLLNLDFWKHPFC